MTKGKEELIGAIRNIITQSRQHVFRVANSALPESYWQIGKLIVEDEQAGKYKAAYGKALLKYLSDQLTTDFYIDLVFYNYLLKCFGIIDIKTETLAHQDIGQLDLYVRMYDDLKKGESDNPTIGILLCSEKDEAIVKYPVLNDKNNLFASKYLLYLPKDLTLEF